MNGVTAPDRPLDTFRPDLSMDQLRLVLWWAAVVPTDATLRRSCTYCLVHFPTDFYPEENPVYSYVIIGRCMYVTCVYWCQIVIKSVHWGLPVLVLLKPTVGFGHCSNILVICLIQKCLGWTFG